MNPSNTVSVTTLIEEIKSELKGQTGSWRKVSELLNQADVEFALNHLLGPLLGTIPCASGSIHNVSAQGFRSTTRQHSWGITQLGLPIS